MALSATVLFTVAHLPSLAKATLSVLFSPGVMKIVASRGVHFFFVPVVTPLCDRRRRAFVTPPKAERNSGFGGYLIIS